MFRLTRFLRELRRGSGSDQPGSPPSGRPAPGPVVIWNLTRTCNLACKHCYANAGNRVYAGELGTAEALAVMEDLRSYRVPALILSGGEPLLRPDIHELAGAARHMGFYVGLSTNGLLIDDAEADRIAATGFDYVGVSLDGLYETHDRFRRRQGAFVASLEGLRRCRDRGIKVGVRFTLTEENKDDLPLLLDLCRRERFEKFYLSHLNYAGRGNLNRRDDAHHRTTRAAMELLFAEAWRRLEEGLPDEFVTGNNDADGAFLLLWAARHFPSRDVEGLRLALEHWGGNATGVGIANIDHLGHVHPDSMWPDHSLGNVRERPFSEIWEDTSGPLLAGLKRRPRAIGGRCATCRFFGVCGGNSRVRASKLTGDPWAEDPGCYLDDLEIHLARPERMVSK